MIEAGTFREDLYHRLAVFPIRLPPLRERPGDILPLAEALLRQAAAELGRPGCDSTTRRARACCRRHLRGNIRELKNLLERAAILAEGEVVRRRAHLAGSRAAIGARRRPRSRRGCGARARAAASDLEELERAAIQRALADAGGNRRRAAEQLGIGLRTLYEKLKRYDIH